MATDLALIARIKQRDASALAELYDRYGARVYSLACAILGEEMAAQEVTQDTFIKLWEHPERYRYDDSRFAAWLLMVARHRAIDYLRRERLRSGQTVSIDYERFPEILDAAHDVETRWRDLQHVLDDLPAEQRDVIMLAYYYGLSQSEIADALKLPLGTVKTRLRLGMEKLRNAIGD
ncbi:MAG: DNA-directed RNA polymerase sigma-70 factor [Candidatus Roseilinea sp.]|jgi:RNA polymerase sigma-70 factor (ECF subfamily)|nr:MAG: DNA-directed RNA polymerase sigma-70 factor [Candidatus Roseilinea sp.]